MVSLGPPPADAMAAKAWAHRMLMTQAYETVMDAGMSQTARRREVRTILVAASKFTDDASRYDLGKKIDADRAELEVRKRARAAARLERVSPAPDDAKIIPIRG